MTRWIGLILLLIGLAVGGRWLWKSGVLKDDREKPREIPTAKAETKDVEAAVTTTGEVVPAHNTEIRSEVSGQVEKVLIASGERVKRGDLLVQLDRKELESQAKELRFGIKATELRLKQVRRELERSRQLIEKKIIPQKEYDDAEIASELAGNDLAIQQAKLETLQQQLAKTSISAPHEGVVLHLEAKEGEVIVGASSVSSGTVLMQIADLTHLLVESNINEIDVTQMELGKPIELTFDSIPNLKIAGKIVFVSPSAGESRKGSKGNGSNNGQAGQGSKTFPITVELGESDPRIKPGITANLKVQVAKVSKAVTVPIAAVFSEEQKAFVYLKKGPVAEGRDPSEAFEKRDVEAGINDDKRVEIKSGLKDGDEVARERPVPADKKPKKKD